MRSAQRRSLRDGLGGGAELHDASPGIPVGTRFKLLDPGFLHRRGDPRPPEDTPKWLCHSMAATSGTLLAVCSCTILPMFAGIEKRGAGIGPAAAFLFSGPTINLMAIILAARVLGLEMGIASLLAAAIFQRL